MLDSKLSTEVNYTAPYRLLFSPRFSLAKGSKAYYISKGAGFKGTLSQNTFILKTGHIGNIKSLNIGGLSKLF